MPSLRCARCCARWRLAWLSMCEARLPPRCDARCSECCCGRWSRQQVRKCTALQRVLLLPALLLSTPPSSRPSLSQDAYFVSGQALRLFGISSSLLIVLVETEWQRFLALAPLLEAWLGRGVLQVMPGGGRSGCDTSAGLAQGAQLLSHSSSVHRTRPPTVPLLQVYQAVLTYREAYPVGETDFHKSLQLYRSGAGERGMGEEKARGRRGGCSWGGSCLSQSVGAEHAPCPPIPALCSRQPFAAGLRQRLLAWSSHVHWRHQAWCVRCPAAAPPPRLACHH